MVLVQLICVDTHGIFCRLICRLIVVMFISVPRGHLNAFSQNKTSTMFMNIYQKRGNFNY